MNSISVRFFFDTLDVAIEALVLLLEDSRVTDKLYEFGSLSPNQIMSSGLLIVGEAEEIVEDINALQGAEMFYE